MNFTKLLFIGAFLCSFAAADAQIFINTGNSNMDKYKKDNPNATIWDDKNNKKEKPAATNDAAPATTTPAVTEAPATEAPAQVTKTTAPIRTPKIKVKAAAKTAPSTPPAEKMAAPAPKSTEASAEYSGTLSEANNTLPPNAEPGKCYARCFVADKYEFKEEQVIDKPVSYKTQTIPAQYKTVFDTVTVRPASVRYIDVPAVYETVVEDIMVSPASQKWVKSSADPSCLSANPADCQVMCLQDVPAVYKKVSRRVVKTPAYKQEIPVAAETKIVSRQVIDVPAQQVQIEIPATYKKVMHKELVRKGGYSDWREILCASKLTTSKIISIQRALKAAGYDPGPLDDVFGAQTKSALLKYQTDKGLPTGNLNMETLKSLGVE